MAHWAIPERAFRADLFNSSGFDGGLSQSSILPQTTAEPLLPSLPHPSPSGYYCVCSLSHKTRAGFWNRVGDMHIVLRMQKQPCI